MTSFKTHTEGVMTRAKGTNRTPQAQGCHHGSPAFANLRTGWTSPNYYHIQPYQDTGQSEGGSAPKTPSRVQSGEPLPFEGAKNQRKGYREGKGLL